MGLLSIDTSPGIVDRLYGVLSLPDVTVADVLEQLTHEDPGVAFAIVEIIDVPSQTVSISVRGDISVDLGGSATTRFRWPERTTWISGEATGVTTVGIALAGQFGAPATLPIARGGIAASHITVDLRHARVEETLALVPVAEAERATADGDQGVVESVATSGYPRVDDVDRVPQPIDLAAMLDPTTWTLLLPDGNELEAAPQIVVGRRPWRSDPDETQTYYVVAPSPHKEISGKHVEFLVVGGDLFARDLDSTNGTVIHTPNEAPRLLHGGGATALVPGDTLDLGDGFRIVVGTRR